MPALRRAVGAVNRRRRLDLMIRAYERDQPHRAWARVRLTCQHLVTVTRTQLELLRDGEPVRVRCPRCGFLRGVVRRDT